MDKKHIRLIKEALMAYGDDEEIIEVLDNLDSLEDNPVPSLDSLTQDKITKAFLYERNIDAKKMLNYRDRDYFQAGFDFAKNWLNNYQNGVENAKKEPKCKICGTKIYINYVCNCPDSEH